MAITRQTPGTLFAFPYAGGTENGANCSAAVPAPATVAAGDLLVIRVSYKPQLFGSAPLWRDTVSTPAGFTLFSSPAHGGGYGDVQANGTGNVTHKFYYKVAAGTEGGTNITVDVAGLNTGNAQILRYSNATGSWGVTASTGEVSAAPASTAWTNTLTDAIGITSGDHILTGLTCTRTANNPDFSAHTISQTGSTFAAVTEDYDIPTGSSNGLDVSGYMCRTECTAGSGTVAPTIGATLFSATDHFRGVTFVVVIKETTATLNGTFLLTDDVTGTFIGTGEAIVKGFSLQLRDTDSDLLKTNLTGLIVSVRTASNATSVIASTTTETTDGTGTLGVELTSGLGINVGDWLYLSIETSDFSIVKTYRLQVIRTNP